MTKPNSFILICWLLTEHVGYSTPSCPSFAALSLVSPHVANAMVPKQPEASSGQSSGELGLDEKELLPPSLRGPPSEDAPAGEEQQRAVGPKTQIDL